MKSITYIFLLFISSSIFSQNDLITIKNEKNGALTEDLAGRAIQVHKLHNGNIIQTYFFNKDSIPIKYRSSTKYKYDDSNRLISSQDFNNEEKIDWEFGFREIKYYPDSIILIFPNANKELTEIEKWFERPSKIIFLLDSLNRITTKKYLNLKDEIVPFSEMRIYSEEFHYDEKNRLKTSLAKLERSSEWSREFNYLDSTNIPKTIEVKMQVESPETDWSHSFTFHNKYSYSVSTSSRFAKPKKSRIINTTGELIPEYGQFHPKYWDNSKGVKQVDFLFEDQYIWLHH